MTNATTNSRRQTVWRWTKRIGRVVLVLVFAASLFAAGWITGFLKLRHAVQTVTHDIGLIVAPNGVQERGYVRLNGVRQWVTASGQDRSAPILLFLHGGPGGVLSDYSYIFQRPWEDYFTVVQWDQRGYGRSAIDADKIRGTTTKEQYVADTIALIEYLRRHFGQQKVVLVGQSWGTLLGIEVARRRPDLLHAYVAIGQVTGWEQNFEGSRRNLIDLARRTNDRALLDSMAKVGPVPTGPHEGQRFAEWDEIVGGALTRLGYSWHNFQGPGESWDERIVTSLMVSPSVSDRELFDRFFNPTNTFKNYYTLHPTITGWDAERDVGTNFQVPMIIISGKYDWQTPIDRAKAYFAKLCAPYKTFVEFPHSAHAVHPEEPGRMVVTLVEKVLPATTGQVPAGAETCQPAKPGR